MLFHLESIVIMVLNKTKQNGFIPCKKMMNFFFLPNISSIANASNILDAPISPDKHAEKTAAIIPITTNGPHILTFCKNK